MTSEQLKEWRNNNSYSQVELAKLLDVTNVCISRWEIGMRHIPSFLHLALKWLEIEKGGDTKTGRSAMKQKLKKTTKRKEVRK